MAVDFRQVGTRDGKGMCRNIKIGKHCALVKYTVAGSRQMIRISSRLQGQQSVQWYLRTEYIRQMTNDSNEYRLADISKEHNVLKCSVQVEYSTKSIICNLTYKQT